MIPFVQAKRQVEAVARAAERSDWKAALLWDAVALLSAPGGKDYTYADAVVETASSEEAMLVTGDVSAAAFAFAVHECGIWNAEVAPRAFRSAAREAWKRFDDRAAQVTEVARGFGWDLSDAWNVTQDVALSEAAEVPRIAKLAGRMYAALRGAVAARVPDVPEETHSVELGSCIPRLLPPELAMLADDELELPVLARIVEKRALQYEVRGSGEAAKGPIVLVLDESGSMHAHRREWSKSAALAIARVAADEKRHVSVVHFSNIATVAELNPKDPASVLAMIRHWYDGGTNVGRALNVAADEVERLEKLGKKGGDVILVTDGIDGNESSQRQATKRITERARLWTVAIDCDVPSSSAIRELATEYIRLGDQQMGDPTTANVFAKAVKR